MNTKQLRLKILDLAIRGKLVPQDPNDEPATALLEKIRTEKERLIKEKKIKRDKNDSSVPSSGMSHYQNVPFEVPENWAWTRLGDICYDFQYGTSEKSEKSGKLIVLRMGNIQNGEIDYTDIAYTKNVTEEEKYLLKKDDLLFNRTNSPELVGKTAIYRGEVPAIFAGYLIRVAPIIIIPDFLNYLMNSDFHRSLCAYSKSDGVSQSNINAQKLSNFLFPIPPLFEQERITSVIKSAFALIDEVEAGRFSIEQLIKQAKIKILDLAIRGKLVKQDPKDEPAYTFMGKIGSKQNIQKITTDIFHYPYNIPENWIWRSITDISVSIQYGYTGAAISLGKYKMLRITDIQNNSVEWNSVPFVEIDDNKAENYLLHNNDIVFARTGATVGKSFLIKHLKEKSIFASYLIRIRLKEAIDIQYVKFFFESSYYWEQIGDKSVGTGQPNVNGTLLGELKIPIPPFAEQHRIVSQIKRIFTHLDSIEKTIKA